MAVRVPVGAWDGPEPEDFESSGGHASQLDALLDDGSFLHAFCERILGDTVAAEDVVQETYFYAVKNLDRLERRGSYAPWLATVARRRSANEVRRRVRLEPMAELPDGPSLQDGDPAETVVDHDTLERVRAAFDGLSPRERFLLERQVFDELSIAELVALDNSTAASVKSVLNRARAKIRAAVDEVHARVVAPVAGLVASLRRQLTNSSAKFHQVAPQLSGSVDRVGEAVTAAVAVLVLGTSVGAPASGDDAPPEFDASSTSPASAAHLPDADRPATGAVPEVGRGGSMPGAPTALAPSPASPGASDGAPPPERERGVTPHLPSPTDNPPVDPSEPAVPKDEADEPEDASFADFGGPAASQSGHVFALGELTYRCMTECTVLFHSADSGATWEQAAAQGMGEATQVLVAPGYPHDPRIFVMGVTGLRLSRDGGATFVQVEEPHQGEAAMSPAFSDGDERILIGAPPSWVYDAGADRTTPLAATPLAGLRNYFAFPPNHAETGLLFAGTLVQGTGGVKTPAVFRCRDMVCEERVELPWGRDVPALAVSSMFTDDGLVFAWIGKLLYRSSDRGLTFEHVDLGISGTVEAVTDDGRGTHFLAWRGSAPEGPVGGMLRSQDGGLTWETIDGGGAVDGGLNTLWVVGDRLLVAPTREAGGGVLCSADGGTTWARRCSAPA